MTTDAKNSYGAFQADPTPANAVQLAIDDHCYGAMQDWPFVEQLRKAKELAEAYPALVAALKEVRTYAQKQLEGHGKGIQPSVRLEAAFVQADELLRDLGEL